MPYGSLQDAILSRLKSTALDKIAIECGKERISYGALIRASDELSCRMAAVGIKEGCHVGVLVANRSIVIAAVIAAWKLRAVFVPLDPNHPISHQEVLARHLDLSIVIVDHSTVSCAEQLSVAVRLPYICVGSDLWHSSNLSNNDLSYPVFHDDDRIYIYATSGTTGRPKAVLGRSASLLHFLDWEIRELGLADNVRVSQLTSPTHDPYLRDVFVPLLVGGTVCIPELSNVILSGAALRDWIDDSRVNLVHCTPSIFRNLCNSGLEQVRFRDLRWILLAGEQVYGKDLVIWYNKFGNRIQLINLYGPTETTLAKFYHFISPTETHSDRIPVGEPINGARYYITPSSPEESIGELSIATPYCTFGYYKDEELTSQCFTYQTNDAGEVEIIYRTGDLVRRHEKNGLEIVGRLDNQLKIFGERIELDEIRGHLLAYPGVINGAIRAISRTDVIRPTELVAYYVSELDDLEDKLRSYFRETMPHFKVPHYYVRISELPLKTNGKLDTDCLPNLFESPTQSTDIVVTSFASNADSSGQGKLSALESKLTAIWAEILGCDTISPQDTFMEIGGDSLAIMLLVAKIENDFNFELSLWDIFEGLTIQILADRIREAQS